MMALPEARCSMTATLRHLGLLVSKGSTYRIVFCLALWWFMPLDNLTLYEVASTGANAKTGGLPRNKKEIASSRPESKWQ